jgi:hypothetical protein
MSQSAHVHSLDAVKAFREALCRFGVDAQSALAAADHEVRRTLDGLQARLEYWQRRVRECQEEVTRAKTALIQRRWGQQDGKGPGTTEAELALRHAQERLREAEAKVEITRRWQRQLPQAVREFEGPARQLGGWLDCDLKYVLALLGSKIESLEAYVTLTAPTLSPDAPPAEAPPPPETAG